MAAHDSSDHAAEHEQRGIGEATLDSPRARDLGDQIEEFARGAVTAGLHSLSGPVPSAPSSR